MLAKLLAAPELINTKLGKIMHGSGKLIMRKCIRMVHGHYKPVLEYKKENGWIKDHVAAQQEAWDFIVNLYRHPINKHAGGWPEGGDDGNKIMFEGALGVFWLMQDEDSAYDIPWLLYMKWIHEHWDRFEQSAEHAYQIMNFPNMYRDMIEWSKPLPLDDGKDFDDDIDYVAAEKKLIGDKNGMGNKS